MTTLDRLRGAALALPGTEEAARAGGLARPRPGAARSRPGRERGGRRG
ncbi:hypothetical protein ACFV28_26550 [Streptomyces sp. NPDC059720]